MDVARPSARAWCPRGLSVRVLDWATLHSDTRHEVRMWTWLAMSTAMAGTPIGPIEADLPPGWTWDGAALRSATGQVLEVKVWERNHPIAGVDGCSLQMALAESEALTEGTAPVDANMPGWAPWIVTVTGITTCRRLPFPVRPEGRAADRSVEVLVVVRGGGTIGEANAVLDALTGAWPVGEAPIGEEVFVVGMANAIFSRRASSAEAHALGTAVGSGQLTLEQGLSALAEIEARPAGSAPPEVEARPEGAAPPPEVEPRPMPDPPRRHPPAVTLLPALAWQFVGGPAQGPRAAVGFGLWTDVVAAGGLPFAWGVGGTLGKGLGRGHLWADAELRGGLGTFVTPGFGLDLTSGVRCDSYAPTVPAACGFPVALGVTADLSDRVRLRVAPRVSFQPVPVRQDGQEIVDGVDEVGARAVLAFGALHADDLGAGGAMSIDWAAAAGVHRVGIAFGTALTR